MELTFKVVTAPGAPDSDILAFIRENDVDFYPPIAARKDLSVFVNSVYEDDGRYILCYDKGRIVGLTTILFHHFMFLTYYHYVAIDRAYRHKGIGSRLYTMVTEMCKDQGAQWAMVKTWSRNSISQSMFRKHGFYHAYTIEDDRSRGVHSYLFIKSFSKIRFTRPVTSVCIAGSGIGVVNFSRTLLAVTREGPGGKGQLPLVVFNDPVLSGASGKVAVSDFIAANMPGYVSHLVCTDISLYGSGQFSNVSQAAEMPDMLNIARCVFTYADKKWLLAGAPGEQLRDAWKTDNVLLPGEGDVARMAEIVEDIAGGYTAPAYYREELAAMAVANGCQGLLLASTELHSAFGFERMYNGIQVFDPLLELAIIIQANRATTL